MQDRLQDIMDGMIEHQGGAKAVISICREVEHGETEWSWIRTANPADLIAIYKKWDSAWVNNDTRSEYRRGMGFDIYRETPVILDGWHTTDVEDVYGTIDFSEMGEFLQNPEYFAQSGQP